MMVKWAGEQNYGSLLLGQFRDGHVSFSRGSAPFIRHDNGARGGEQTTDAPNTGAIWLSAGGLEGNAVTVKRGQSRERSCQYTCRGPDAPAHREDVYFRTADFFGGAVFFRRAPFRVGALRASLTALPAWNRTALLAA